MDSKVFSILILLILVCASVQGHKPKTSFEITDSKIGELNTKVLSNSATGEYAEIVVDFGGRVEELVLLSPFSDGQSHSYRKRSGTLHKILLSHNGNATAIKQNAWWKGMFLVPWANRIAYGKYTFYNSTYQLPLNEQSTDPPRSNAMHGLLVDRIMTVNAATTDTTSAKLTLSHSFKNEVGYPFEWYYEITYTLSDVGLDISITVENKMAEQPLPLYIGWHPYFVCTPHSSIITFDQCTRWNHVQLNANMNPTGITSPGTPFDGNTPIGGTPGHPTFYDDEYKAVDSLLVCGQLKTKLHDVEGGKTVVLYQSQNMRLVHVFTGYLEEGSIAMEPMSGMADAYNNHDHLSVLSGGELWKASFGIYLE